MEKLYLSEDEKNLICSTPPKECWLCNELSNNIYKSGNKFYFLKSTS